MQRVIMAVLLFAATPAFAADLALKRVMLSSAGVGYFEYAADVDGPVALGLDVPLEQVDDVLNSLVVFDSTGGVGTIELPGRDNTRASFGNLPFGPAALQSPVDYLNSLQGVEISVQGPRPMSGRIVHAEPITETVPTAPGQPPAAVRRTRVTLLGAAGLQQFVLEDAESVQVTDPDLRGRIGQALDSLRREASRSMRHITLHSDGTGHRTVRVGYVAAAPLWKATYRLVLPAKDGDPARLQGWAVLENQSGADWNGISLTLQYGNPVTFRQAIYQSYYVQRPEVPVEILGRILPNIDTRAQPAQMAKSAPAGAAAFGAPAPRLHRHRSPWSSRAPCRWRHPPTRFRSRKARKKPSSSCRCRLTSQRVTPPACRSWIATFRRNALTSIAATARIRCPRSASPTTPAPRCPPAC